MYRVIETPTDTEWDECLLHEFSHDASGWVEHRWIDDDKLYRLTRFNDEGAEVEFEEYSWLENHLPDMYAEHPDAEDEILFPDLDMALDS